MKQIILSIVLCFPIVAIAQGEFPRFEKDTLYINQYDWFVKGSKLKTGRGTLPNGSFKYITTSPGSFVALMSATQQDPGRGITPLGASYSGHLLETKQYKRYGNKKRGYKYYLVVGGGNIVNYLVDIENAIATGEVLSNAPSAGTGTTASVADEIKKLKDLLDSGAITQEEYDAQKKKLLGN